MSNVRRRCHRRDSRGALGRREAFTSSVEGAAGRSGPDIFLSTLFHRHGAARRARLLDAAGGDQYAGHVVLYGQRVRIVAGRYAAEHPRKFVGQPGFSWRSIGPHWWQQYRKRGRRYLKLQQLLELGEPAIRYLTEI